MASQRVSPPRVFPQATRAAKPPPSAAGSADAYRQTTFALGTEVELAVALLEFEGQLAAASTGARYRSQQMAAALGPWSRSWLSRLAALHALEWGNYAAALPLVRAAADYQAAGVALLRNAAGEWEEWLAGGGIALAPADHALEYRLHAFRSGEVLASHDVLGPVYRISTDLSLPHFGATLLVAGDASDPARVALTFGDRDFHLGLAELVLGWLFMLSAAQVEPLLEFDTNFSVTDPAAARERAAATRAAAARPERCQIEVLQRDEGQRYIVRNWRRQPGAAYRRILL
ncbi:MAG: hypothetical protein ACR2HN_09410 [Tepidiformaceae bacterium]